MTLERRTKIIKTAAFAVAGLFVALVAWGRSGTPCLEPFRVLRVEERAYNTGFSAALSPDGKSAAIGLKDGTLAVLDAESMQTITRIASRKREPAYDIAFSPDGNKVLACQGSAGIVWDIQNKRTLLLESQFGSTLNSIAYSPDGSMAAAAYDYAVIWDASSGGELHRVAYTDYKQEYGEGFIQMHTSIQSVDFFPDGKHLLLKTCTSSIEPGTGMGGIHYAVWDIGNATQTQIIGGSFHYADAAVSPDGGGVAVAGIHSHHASSIDLVRVNAGGGETETRTHFLIPDRMQSTRRVAFSPDGRYLLSAGSARVEFGDKLYLTRPSWFGNAVRSIRHWFHSSNNIVSQQALILWDVRTGKRLYAMGRGISGNRHHYKQIQFSQDGTRIMAAVSDGTVWIWDIPHQAGGSPTSSAV